MKPVTLVGSWREGPHGGPEPTTGREGSGLCLSGGGYRAALFHLGAARRLNELGLLHTLDTVSSVSGGSLFSALMATTLPWTQQRAFSNQEINQLQCCTRRLCAQDIRTLPILRRLWPTRWSGPPAILDVARLLEEHIRGPLTGLPDTPEFLFCASDLGNGTNWTFGRERSGGYLAGDIDSAALNWPLARAAAVSACFPPVFQPVILNGPGLHGPVTLNDGGNYDNLGLEPVWKRRAVVLVSDGGGRSQRGVGNNRWSQLLRFVTMGDAQARSLRRRWLIADARRQIYHAVYWAVSQDVSVFAPRLPPDAECLREGYPPPVAQAIGRIRTDLNHFTPDEQGLLENHGYTLADAALQAYFPFRPPSTPWPDLHLPHSHLRPGSGEVAALTRRR